MIWRNWGLINAYNVYDQLAFDITAEHPYLGKAVRLRTHNTCEVDLILGADEAALLSLRIANALIALEDEDN